MSGTAEGFLYLVIGVLVLFVVLAICRELVCWWLKTTEIVKILGQIRDELRSTQGKPVRPPVATCMGRLKQKLDARKKKGIDVDAEEK